MKKILHIFSLDKLPFTSIVASLKTHILTKKKKKKVCFFCSGEPGLEVFPGLASNKIWIHIFFAYPRPYLCNDFEEMHQKAALMGS